MTPPELLSLLDQLERSEAALLTWGYVDSGFTEEEVISQVQRLLNLDEFEAEEAIEELLGTDGSSGPGEGGGSSTAPDRRKRSASWHDCANSSRNISRMDRGGMRRLWFRISGTRSGREHTQSGPQTPPTLPLDRAGRNGIVRQAIMALLSRGDRFKLARFQVLAAQRILEDLEGRTSRGVIIGAGTGSGKTLAFYLPALATSRAASAGSGGQSRCRLPEERTAQRPVLRDLRGSTPPRRLLAGSGRRKLTIGAFFGLTPHSAQALLTQPGWQRLGTGFIAPTCAARAAAVISYGRKTMSGPIANAWPAAGRMRRDRREDEVVLTRARMRGMPPDVLFTTTEMLNRQLSDGTNGHVFGVGPSAARKPEVMLLDEVHTYEGTTGAQAAYVIRRWRHAIGRPVQFVGLSATLRDAQTFFAQLVGLADHAVSSITPSGDDLISEGMEYLLALRGDPVSGTSLLSTTIQASMLLRRILDRDPPATSAFGSRLFVFTDDLDVTNRLYFDLLDAEGRNSWGGRPAGKRAARRPALEHRTRSRRPAGTRPGLGHVRRHRHPP